MSCFARLRAKRILGKRYLFCTLLSVSDCPQAVALVCCCPCAHRAAARPAPQVAAPLIGCRCRRSDRRPVSIQRGKLCPDRREPPRFSAVVFGICPLESPLMGLACAVSRSSRFPVKLCPEYQTPRKTHCRAFQRVPLFKANSSRRIACRKSSFSCFNSWFCSAVSL